MKHALFFVVWLIYWVALWLTRLEFEQSLTLEGMVTSLSGAWFLLGGLTLYLAGARLADSRLFVLALATVAILILLCTPLLLSSDVYLYAMRGRMVGIYGANPYRIAPVAFPEDPFYELVFGGWRPMLQPYGPLWTTLSGTIASTGSHAVEATLLRYQLFGTAGLLALGTLTLCLPSRTDGESRTRVLYLLLCNPVLLVEFVNNAHNDVWMIVFGFAALVAYERDHPALVLPLITVAGLIKYSFFICVPVACLLLLRERKISFRAFVGSLFAAASIAFLCTYPYFYGREFFEGVKEVARYQPLYASFPGGMVALAALGHTVAAKLPLLERLLPASPEEALFWGRALFIPLMLVSVYRARDLGSAFEHTLILSTLLLSAVFLPWYVTWWLPFSAVRHGTSTAGFWTAVALLAYHLRYATAVALPLVGGMLLLTLVAVRLFERWQVHQLVRAPVR
ncbi:MAG: hypothetical protein KDD69_02545 [Bdellovibrionales bacterium]|nr:hypothetical protein [Bdellovibrionales bacterium]